MRGRGGSAAASGTLYDATMTVDPASLKIQLYPASILRERCEPVTYTDNVRAIAERMVEMMYKADGVGLAAPQVGLPWMLFVADVPEDEGRSSETTPPSASSGAEVFINPEIVDTTGIPEPMAEGCLSLPGVLGEVFRPPTVTIRALDLEGNPFERTATGLLGRCYLHEYDHLTGVLILDKMNDRELRKNKTLISSLERRAR